MFFCQSSCRDCLLEYRGELLRIHRFGNVVGCTLFHGCNSIFNFAVPGNHHDLNVGKVSLGVVQEFQTGCVWHPQVDDGDHHVFRELVDCLTSISRKASSITKVRDDLIEEVNSSRIIVGNEDQLVGDVSG